MSKIVPHVVYTVVDVNKVIDLRHRILRAGLPIEAAHFEGDREPHTHHIAACPVGESTPICCASFMLNMFGRVPAWQLRGMATEPSYQGRGVGTQLLTWAEWLLKDEPEYAYIETLWCNARQPAVKFYESNGWRRASRVFDIPTAGPHYEMVKNI